VGDFSGETVISLASGAESGAVDDIPPFPDDRLNSLISAWSSLTELQRGQIWSISGISSSTEGRPGINEPGDHQEI